MIKPNAQMIGKGVSIEHERGKPPIATLAISRNLKGGKLDYVELDRYELITLIESAASALRIITTR